MLKNLGKPFLTIFIVWHPSFKHGLQIASAIKEHLHNQIFKNVSGDLGINVVYRFAQSSSKQELQAVDLHESETTAVVMLIDTTLTGDKKWKCYIQDIADQTRNHGFSVTSFPVLIESDSKNKISLPEQALLWYRWNGNFEQRQHKLIQNLTVEFCRMLRHYIECQRPTDEDETQMRSRYRQKFDIFISHSNHDDHGKKITDDIRKSIQEKAPALDVFVADRNIPAGMKFNDELVDRVRSSAVIAIHTDSYSSREWCRREVIEAKLHNSPVVVANCIHKSDDCMFPYIGNVPSIRINNRKDDKRIDFLISRLLDELFKDFLCRCLVKMINLTTGFHVNLISRPPELICLAQRQITNDNVPLSIVYPGPPVNDEELKLFSRISPKTKLMTLTEWKADQYQ